MNQNINFSMANGWNSKEVEKKIMNKYEDREKKNKSNHIDVTRSDHSSIFGAMMLMTITHT